MPSLGALAFLELPWQDGQDPLFDYNLSYNQTLMRFLDIKTFIKQHTIVPNAFVDSFLSMYDPETVQTDLSVDADKAASWLGIKKFTLMKTLRESYHEGLDYQVTKKQQHLKAAARARADGRTTNAYKTVLLTPDCFKRVCMQSRSRKANEARTYFLELESLIVRYREALQRGMAAEIASLDRAQKPKDPEDSAGYVYVLQAVPERDSVYKIGRTQNLTKRLSTYNTGRVDGVEVVFKFRTDSHKATEACVKALMRAHQYRKYKEVYEADLEMIKNIIKGCDGIAHYQQVYTKRHRAAKGAAGMTGGSGAYYIVLAQDSPSEA